MDGQVLEPGHGEKLRCLGDVAALIDDRQLRQVRKKDRLRRGDFEDALALGRERNEVGHLLHDLRELAFAEGTAFRCEMRDLRPGDPEEVAWVHDANNGDLA